MEHFSYRIGSYTRNLGRPPVFYHSNDLISEGCSYASVYAIRQEDSQAIEQAGTAAGFKGIVWSQRLWLDFDNKEASERAQSKLKEGDYDFVVYDTGGNRGSHIGVFRDAKPSHLLPSQDKAYAMANFPGCDPSLYWHLHLLRLPGAIHEKTGNPKRLLYSSQGSNSIVLPQWVPVATPQLELEPSPPRSSIFGCWDVVRHLNLDSEEGNRHKHLVLLVKALQADAGVSQSEAKWVAMEVNRGFGEPKSEEEVDGIIRWAYGG